MIDLISRYTAKGKASELIDSYGLYFQIEKPEREHAYVDFQNVTLRLQKGSNASQNLFVAVPKAQSNNCYFGLPLSLEYRPPAAEKV